MKKLLALGAILVISVILVATQSWMVTSQYRATEPWRAALDHYIENLAGRYDLREPVVQVVGAELPRNFTDIELATYGNVSHFATDQQAPPTPATTQIWRDPPEPVFTPTSVLSGVWIATPAAPVAEETIVPTPTVSQTYPTRSNAILPYPPSDVRCVQLRQTDGQSRIVFVARHDDLYWSEWIVHEGEATPLSAEFSTFLDQIGCDLNLETAN